MAIKIYIDQGHNPENPNAGAEGNGLREQDITYRVGKALGKSIREFKEEVKPEDEKASSEKNEEEA